mmetsp:Transcript_25752/g.43395  ORF Transcript_25752/g.43395 Transcript_25752/m.43395 type:complete len:85 (-) Transcript_25752:2399-2653(-)
MEERELTINEMKLEELPQRCEEDMWSSRSVHTDTKQPRSQQSTDAALGMSGFELNSNDSPSWLMKLARESSKPLSMPSPPCMGT